MDETIKEVRRKGHVRTISGYRLEVPQDRSYIGTNYKIQGSAGDILNQAMIDANKWLSPDDDFPKNNVGKLIMCIHDELVFDFKKGKADGAAEKIKEIMETAGDLFGVVTPVDVDRIDNRWSDKKGIDV